MRIVTDPVHDAVAGLLRGGGHRYTSGRRRVISALRSEMTPLTIPQILEVDRALPQSSVYRNLATLEEVGAVTRIVTGDDHGRFELAEKLTGHHHHHLICESCGSVNDFELPPDTEAALDEVFSRVANDSKFQLEGHRLDLLGTCDVCV